MPVDKSSRKIWVGGQVIVRLVLPLFLLFPIMARAATSPSSFDFTQFFNLKNVGGSDLQNIVWALIGLVITIFIEVVRVVWQILQALGII